MASRSSQAVHQPCPPGAGRLARGNLESDPGTACPPKRGSLLRPGTAAEVHRKSTRADSVDMRMLSEQDGEDASMVVTNGFRRKSAAGVAPVPEPTEQEASEALAELQDQASRITSASHAPPRSTAAVKWERAHAIAEAAPAIELWGSNLDRVNGIYRYVLDPREKGPPTYVCESSETCKWLFVATSGGWWLGDAEAKAPRLQRGWLRGEAMEAGTLPHEVQTWEKPNSGEWQPQAATRFWLSESVAVEWQRLRLAAFQAPVVSIHGVVDAFVDGLYDFVPADGSAGEPPAFQHQQRPNLWLFLARDQRWWIGSAKDKQARDDRGIVHSATVQPGVHPSKATGWHVRVTKVWEECRALRVSLAPGASRARDLWARACRDARAVQIWGLEGFHGEYDAYLNNLAEPPAYQSQTDPDVWLHLAMDGCWWLSDTISKDEGRARGFMRSDMVPPGTLPHKVGRWLELQNKSWEVNSMVRVMCGEVVQEDWQAAREDVEEVQVIEVQGVSGPSLNGLYDLLEADRESCEPPVFQNQINQELFLYVAEDGRWWVGNKAAMSEHSAKGGRMHSDVIRPGMLPTARGLGWHVFCRTSKEWERQDSVIVS